ncbi:hypothetical protein H1R20_g10137, partial [Candolleomyces eurysporus]
MAEGIFNGAHDFHIDRLNIIKTLGSPLKDLESRIAPGALHDSAERSDAPKCHPETRIAVQDEVHSWIVHGDGHPQPRKIKWITGPAGTGKTAVMGSLAERCHEEDLLAASFFFASWSASTNRRRKTFFVPTLAYQLALLNEELKTAISDAIERSPVVFEKNLRVQIETLVLEPLREVVARSDLSSWPKVIMIDGLDECEAEQYHDADAGLRGKPAQERSKEKDQLEILQALHDASKEPAFPFRVVIASRPERVIRQFFQLVESHGSLASILVLDEKYNPDADIALFLEAKFAEVGWGRNLGPLWPPAGVIGRLVERASGQFIYAATVVRFVSDSRIGNPHALLDLVLKVEASRSLPTNPFAHLDALYAHILQSSPDPVHSVKWMWIINGSVGRSIDSDLDKTPSAFSLNQFLQSFHGEPEHLLGDLHSLMKVPPPDDIQTPYNFYHKSLFDFLSHPDRSGTLYVNLEAREAFFWLRYFDMLSKKGVVARGFDETRDKLLSDLYFSFNLRFLINPPMAHCFELPDSSVDCPRCRMLTIFLPSSVK